MQAKGVWRFGDWEDVLEKSCSFREVALEVFVRKVVVYGIGLSRAFMGHILVDGMSAFWLDGHADVLGRLLHKSFPIHLLCDGE